MKKKRPVGWQNIDLTPIKQALERGWGDQFRVCVGKDGKSFHWMFGATIYSDFLEMLDALKYIQKHQKKLYSMDEYIKILEKRQKKPPKPKKGEKVCFNVKSAKKHFQS